MSASVVSSYYQNTQHHGTLALRLCTVAAFNRVQGMPIDSSVAELITAQLFVLSQEAPDPIYFYINSTGIAVSGGLLL